MFAVYSVTAMKLLSRRAHQSEVLSQRWPMRGFVIVWGWWESRVEL